MSDNNSNKNTRDRGFTLPEVLISVTLTAVLLTSLGAAIVVTLRSADNNLGRTNNARSEQNVGLWMPGDLASAETVNTDPWSNPCGDAGQAACPSTLVLDGSNTLLLVWHGSEVDTSTNTPVPTTTAVSYRYVQEGDQWVLRRVQCSWREPASGTASCSSVVVLDELDPPPPGVTWVPGTTAPDWVIKVTSALAADDTSSVTADVTDPGLSTKNARRVLVTINGGGDVEGIGGGRNTFSFSAGGTNRETSLSTDDLGGAPTFTAARTRCGGNFGLIVDKSTSIGAEFPAMLAGLASFVDTFAGKPVRLQVVTFSQVSQTLGGSADTGGWTRYYDMLEPADVADLKSKIAAVTMSSYTNWEEGWYRMLRNPDGTLRTVLPDKVIFFTDGLPNTSRLEARSSGTAPAVPDPADAGLPTSSINGLYQKAWNRTSRLIVDSGATDIVGVLVGDASDGSTTWSTAGAGYVYVYEVGSGVTFEQQTGVAYERGNNVVFEQGSGSAYYRNNNVVYERGYNEVPQINNNVVFERATTGLVWERLVSGSWTSTSWSTYRSNNTTPDSTDGWRTRVTGTLGSWTSISNSSQYYNTNLTADSSDGYRSRVSGGLSSTWTNVTLGQYNTNNTTADSTDGWRLNKVYSSPYTLWESVTESAYVTGNSVPADTDGWRTRVNGGLSTGWTSVSSALFGESNLTSDDSDGWRQEGTSLPPYTTWTAVTESAYNAANTVAGESDGWRTRQTATSTTWTPVAQSVYDLSNTTTDATDGWRSSPVWTSVTKAAYEAGNSTSSQSDGWRTVLPGSASTTWVTTTKAAYDTSNTTSDGSDHWRRVKTYPVGAPSYDGFEAVTNTSKLNKLVLADLVAPGGATYAVFNPALEPPGYGDVREVNMFVETDWSRFDEAIRDVALGECGGTVTIQTRNQSTGTAVADPFTYTNQTFQTVETSGAYKSGTFDVVLPGAAPGTLNVSVQNQSSLNAWEHVSWSCKARGVNLTSPVMTTTTETSGWNTLNLQVSANDAISCVHTVRPA
jgi:prepilin-type N-terminal cleavage/methylation domain-containing protein